MRKILIIEFSQFNGIRTMRATHYYLDGKRISHNTYINVTCGDNRNWRHDGTRQWENRNKSGVRREYTEITYKNVAA